MKKYKLWRYNITGITCIFLPCQLILVGSNSTYLYNKLFISNRWVMCKRINKFNKMYTAVQIIIIIISSGK